MLDDPYAIRTDTHPAPDRTGLILTDGLPHAHGPLRLYAQRLLLLIIVCYTVLALLFIVSSQSFAASPEPSTTLVENSLTTN